MTTIAAFLLVISLIVLVHELGHYAMARYFGVRIEVFSIGLGPKLLTMRRRGTDYCLGAIPLGGYVKMAGERFSLEKTGDEFLSKNKWQRGLILVAGPAMNLILAAVIIAGVAITGFDTLSLYGAPATVGSVIPGSPAERAGIAAGDQIVSVAGQSTTTWESVEAAIGMRPDRDVLLTLRRHGQTLVVNVTPISDSRLGVGTIGVAPSLDPVVTSVVPGGAADRAGIRAGDIITAVNGSPAASSGTSPRQPLATGSHDIQVIVRRDAREHTVTIVPAGADGDVGYSAVTPIQLHPVGAFAGVRLGIAWTVDTAAVVLQTIQGLAMGRISPRQLMGPVGIGQLAGEAADISLTALFCIVALLSVNVGVMNLLPIPVLDGGHLFMLGVEGVTRRDLSAPARRIVTKVGLVMLLILTIVVVCNDLSRLAWLQRLIVS
jgi:regulator of sigma E protease